MTVTTRLLTVPEFARATGISEGLARRLVKDREVPSITVGGRQRVDSRWVEKWTAQGNPPIGRGEPAK